MTKRFKVNVADPKVWSAANLANLLLSDDSMLMRAIGRKNDFAYNSGQGADVVKKLLAEHDLIPVYTYRPFWRWSKVVGYFQNGEIHINIYKLQSMTDQDVASNLVHEYCHFAGFSHGNNTPSEFKNNFSVPYFCSEFVSKIKTVSL